MASPEVIKLLKEVLDEYRQLTYKSIDADRLAREVLTLNPSSGELGEGKARRLIELAEEVLRDSD